METLTSSQESSGNIFDSNLPSAVWSLEQGCEFYDEALEEAERQALASGTITPLVKQELRLLIQTRRLSQGKDEMRVAFGQPTEHKLTQAEEDRRRRRKQQNKIAARRFRKNKKLKESILVEDIAMLEGKNSGLRDKITELQQIKESLIHHLTHHLIVCPYYPELPTLAVPTPTASPTPSPSTTAFQATVCPEQHPSIP